MQLAPGASGMRSVDVVCVRKTPNIRTPYESIRSTENFVAHFSCNHTHLMRNENAEVVIQTPDGLDVQFNLFQKNSKCWAFGRVLTKFHAELTRT